VDAGGEGKKGTYLVESPDLDQLKLEKKSRGEKLNFSLHLGTLIQSGIGPEKGELQDRSCYLCVEGVRDGGKSVQKGRKQKRS